MIYDNVSVAFKTTAVFFADTTDIKWAIINSQNTSNLKTLNLINSNNLLSEKYFFVSPNYKFYFF